MRKRKSPSKKRTGADLIAALQSSPHRDIEIEPERIKSDLPRIDRMKDEDIDYSDIPPLDDAFLAQPPVSHDPERYRVLNPLPPSKLEWLKQQRLRVAEMFRLFKP